MLELSISILSSSELKFSTSRVIHSTYPTSPDVRHLSFMVDNWQGTLSERLQLLHELSYSDLDMPYQGAGTHSNKASRDFDTHRDVRLLDTIAVALTTGKPGDVFAAAFDRRQHMALVLAKNGPPTPEDTEAADELISLIGNPAVQDATHLLPFLFKRCGENIEKRIYNLHKSLQEMRGDFRLALQTYIPAASIQAEFPDADLLDWLLREYGDTVPPFSIVWEDLVETIIEDTAHGLYPEDMDSSKKKYEDLFLFADTLSHSRFLHALVNSRDVLNNDLKERAQRLKRRLYKICQYVTGITNLIEQAKRLFPIPHHWVTDDFGATGEGVFDLCDDVHDAVSRGLNRLFLSPEIIDKLDRHFPHLRSNWAMHQTVHACVHAELRIILHLGLSSPSGPSPTTLVHPIGVSKRSCFCCSLWIDTHNRIFNTRWSTSGSHGKPYANWAFPGSACSYAVGLDGMSVVDKDVLDVVSIRLTDKLDWLFPSKRRISDELFSSSDEVSDGERRHQHQQTILAARRPDRRFIRRK
jgi:hypothetical protein